MVSTETINKNLRKLRGIIRRCLHCGKTRKCEFAHLRPTPIFDQPQPKKRSGQGRGNRHRYYDIIYHLCDYSYLCKTCHERFDHHRESFGEMPKSLCDFVMAIFRGKHFSSFVALSQ